VVRSTGVAFERRRLVLGVRDADLVEVARD
jgi:hypothetical protein